MQRHLLPWLFPLSAVLLCLFPRPVDAQPGVFPPGLSARYTADGETVEQIEPDVSFNWNQAAPDPRLPEGSFQARWKGLLLVREDAPYTFHAYVQGAVTVTLDGREVLAAETAEPRWVSGAAVEMPFGEQPFEVTFRKTRPSARVHLFWSSERFPLEPVPAHLLFHEETRPDLAKIDQGRRFYAAYRCNRCHRRENEPLAPDAPALTHIAGGLSSEQLIAQIESPQQNSPHARMPSFGFSTDETKAIAAFLLDRAKQPKLQNVPPVQSKEREKQRRQGEVLFRSLGCLACHTAGKHGTAGPYSGGDLSAIGAKRSEAWLYTWLAQPEKLNRDHRMPVFKLSDEERRQLALYLSGLENKEAGDVSAKSSPAVRNSRAAVERGRELVEQARCAACHRIEGMQADLAAIPSLSQSDVDWDDSCLQAEPDRKQWRPAYRDIEQKAIKAFVKSRFGRLSPLSDFDLGRRVLERRNCLACHERQGADGIVSVAGSMAQLDDALRGQSQAMIPPNLTAVGDKLLDEALTRAVSGKQKQRRLPWLRVRMPRFEHAEAGKQALVDYLIDHDRIPAGAPRTKLRADLADTDASEVLLAGHTLVGAKGFSCIACHEAGDYKPRNVAPGTHGSDLLMPGERMRKEYFLRWTRAPLRIVPGTEMPAIKKPVRGVLGGNVDRQLAAVWEALNDPDFTVPTNPSVVEQFVVVEPDEPARIIRDVFTNSEKNGGGYTARAFAVGFGNGHSLLFDLDRFSLRDWRFGDFARQRAEGKSWFWDMAGVPVMAGFDGASDLVLQRSPASRRSRASEPKLIRPRREHGTNGRLLDYEQDDRGVRLRYEVDFGLDGDLHKIHVTEILTPLEQPDRTGWRRRIEVESIPSGYRLLLARPQATPAVESAQVDYATGSASHWQSLTAADDFVRVGEASEGGPTVVRFRYLARLTRPELDLQSPPPQTHDIAQVTSAPGFDGVRLPLKTSLLPTALTWTNDGTLAFTSLRGQVYLARDTDGDGIEDELTVFEEGLAAPFGILADGDDLIVSHKPEVIRLRDTDGDGRADHREVIATGWGYTENYHDWTCSIVRDSRGRMYVGLGSDYAQKNRPKNKARWRGKVLRISPSGEITPVGHSLRYPTGLAVNENDEVFITDNQGVQNTFNEINHLVEGWHYGVPSRYETRDDIAHKPPAIQVPHPWTRSVNGIFFLPPDASDRTVYGFGGHGVGCEYNKRFLVRFTLQKVAGRMQGATYALTRFRDEVTGGSNFIGPMCGGVGPDGHIYIGGFHDSGWRGGPNRGEIVRLEPNDNLPNGIRELRAVPEGFAIEFNRPVDSEAAARPENYSISGYTRVWKGGYATPDSGRHTLEVDTAEVAGDARKVVLHVDGRREGYVYDVTCGDIGRKNEGKLWPATGHYTLHRIPQREAASKVEEGG